MVDDEQFALLRLHLQKALVGALVNLGDGLALHSVQGDGAAEGMLLVHNKLSINNMQKVFSLRQYRFI